MPKRFENDNQVTTVTHINTWAINLPYYSQHKYYT